jgi:hypothetical protein
MKIKIQEKLSDIIIIAWVLSMLCVITFIIKLYLVSLK